MTRSEHQSYHTSGEKNCWYGRDCNGEKHPLFGRTGENSPNYGSKRTKETKLKMSHSQAGENNPMYGRFWITDGIKNKAWKL